MTPIQYFTENHQAILEAYTLANGQVKQTWTELNNTLPGLAEAMSYNSFKAYLPAFAAGFNLAMDRVKQAKQTDQAKLERVKQGLNRKQAELEAVQAELYRVKQVKQTIIEQVEQTDQAAPKTVNGWSVQFSGGYYRAFRKINGKVEGVYLGKYFDHDQASAKIQAKEKQLQAKSGNDSTSFDFK